MFDTNNLNIYKMINKRTFYKICSLGLVISLIGMILCILWANETNKSIFPLTMWEYLLPVIGIVASFIIAMIFLIAGLGEYKPDKTDPIANPMLIPWFEDMKYRVSYIDNGYPIHKYCKKMEEVINEIQELKLYHPDTDCVTITWRKI